MSKCSCLRELTSKKELEAFLEEFEIVLIFKAGICHKTMQAFGQIEQVLRRRPELPIGIVREKDAELSSYVAELTEVAHETPQIMLLMQKRPLFDLDNWDITAEALEEEFFQYFGPAAVSRQPSQSSSDLNRYIQLLEKLLAGDVDEDAFEVSWLSTFQSDQTLRSAEEFELLNSLYGDVNEALAMRLFPAVCSLGSFGCEHKTLAEKALQLKTSLKARTYALN